jgi:hypothetical protein
MISRIATAIDGDPCLQLVAASIDKPAQELQQLSDFDPRLSLVALPTLRSVAITGTNRTRRLPRLDILTGDGADLVPIFQQSACCDLWRTRRDDLFAIEIGAPMLGTIIGRSYAIAGHRPWMLWGSPPLKGGME